MTTPTAAFLQQHAIISSEPAQVTAPDNFACPLPHYGLLAVSGPDAEKFLQGQTTCNLPEVNGQLSKSGACCTAKGRVYSNFLALLAQQENYLLRMRSEQIAETAKRLGKYIVFSKAELNDCSSDYLLLGLKGKQAQRNIERHFGALPQTHGQISDSQGAILIAIDEQHFECWLPAEHSGAISQALCRDLPVIAPSNWQLAAIRRGQPELTEATCEQFTPHMINLQLLDAISFKKGCYTGQEVVARTQYKATLKRQMQRIKINGQQLDSHEEILTADGAQRVGSIVNFIDTDNGYIEALAVLSNEQLQNTLITGSNNLTIEVLSLPYAITTEG